MWKFMLSKVFKMRDKFAVDLGQGDEEKPFMEHLEDLRTMIVRIVTTLLVATIGTFFFYEWLFEVIKQPLWNAGIVKTKEQMEAMLQVLGPTEGFMMAMNISLIAAIIVAFPFLLMFLLQFILPGLKSNEKKLIFPAIAIGMGLFLAGVSFSYFVVLPKALEFFSSFNSSLGFGNTWRVNEYVTFATRFVLIFGISFELPVLVMALVKLDILNYKLMKGTRLHAIVGIAIFAAVITPTSDPLTMMLMMGPLCLLYEICIWLAYTMNKKDREMYPEYYKDLDKDEAELAKEGEAEWDNEDYNPWSTADDDDDEETVKRKNAESSTTEATKPDENKPAAESVEPVEDKPESEKTLEDYSRDDEKRNTD